MIQIIMLNFLTSSLIILLFKLMLFFKRPHVLPLKNGKECSGWKIFEKRRGV